MAGQPILPRDLSNPSMTAGIQRTALARIRRHEKAIKAKMRELVDSIPYRRVDAETGMVVNSSLPDDHWLYANQTITYQFDLSASVLEQLSDRIDAILWSEWMETESTRPPADWWLYSAVDNAYEQGTAQAVTNLAAISDEYTRTIASVISNPAYADRIAFVRARQFELMRGLTDETRANLADTLARAMQAGENPLAIKKEIQKRVGVSASRAERIARTEISTSHRRARLAEAQDAEERLGIRTKMMWLSALSPTTRRTHAARHGKLYTRQEVEDFYSRDGNAINCYLPGTTVQGRFVAGSKAFYKGEAIRIVTASGNHLAVTPNHPVMTDRGLIPAAEVHEGLNLVAYDSVVENPVGVSPLDGELINAEIQDVFCSIVELGNSFSRRVVGVDFHGDGGGMDEDVSIVELDRILTLAADADRIQVLEQLKFILADSEVSESLRPLALHIFRVLLSASSGMGVSGDDLALLAVGMSEAIESTLASIAPLKAESCHVLVYALSGNIVLSTEGEDGFTVDVSLVDLSDNDLHFLSIVLQRAKAMRFEYVADRSVAAPYVFSDTLDASSGLISLDQIISAESFFYRGHVYDLQEVSGLMVANGLISSNCKCSQTEILVDEDGNPLDGGKAMERLQARSKKFLRVMPLQ